MPAVHGAKRPVQDLCRGEQYRYQSFDESLRKAVMKFSILWVDEVYRDLRLRSMHNPEKKGSTISVIVEPQCRLFLGQLFRKDPMATGSRCQN
jgi:hypothetical protein